MRYAQGYGADLSTSHVQRFSRAVLGGKSIDRGEILRQFGDRDRGINNPGKTQMIELEHLMVSAREGLKELQRRCDETGVIEKKRYLQYTWERKKELEQQKKGKG